MNQKKDLNRIGLMLVVYNIAMSLMAVIVSVLVDGIGYVMDNMGQDGFWFHELAPVSGYLMGLLAGILVIIIFSKKELFAKKLDVQKQHMGIQGFFTGVMVLLGLQMFYSILSTFVELGMNQAGLTLQSSIDAASGMGQNLSMILYTVLAGPVAEELVFRGAILRGLEKYGKSFAIVFSAFLFGVYHGNFLQGMFAFTMGLLFAYVAEEYSIKWSMALHLFNNCLTVALGYAQEYLGAGVIDGPVNVLFFVSMIGTGLWLVRNRRVVGEYIAEHPAVPGTVWTAMTRPTFIVFIIYEVLIAFTGVQRV